MCKMFSKKSTKAVRMLLPLKTKKVTNIATIMAFKSSCQIFPAITTNLAIFTTELGRSTSFVAYFPHSVSPFSRPFHTTSVANITKQIGGKQKVFPFCCKFVDHAMVFATVYMRILQRAVNNTQLGLKAESYSSVKSVPSNIFVFILRRKSHHRY